MAVSLSSSLTQLSKMLIFFFFFLFSRSLLYWSQAVNVFGWLLILRVSSGSSHSVPRQQVTCNGQLSYKFQSEEHPPLAIALVLKCNTWGQHLWLLLYFRPGLDLMQKILLRSLKEWEGWSSPSCHSRPSSALSKLLPNENQVHDYIIRTEVHLRETYSGQVKGRFSSRIQSPHILWKCSSVQEQAQVITIFYVASVEHFSSFIDSLWGRTFVRTNQVHADRAL